MYKAAVTVCFLKSHFQVFASLCDFMHAVSLLKYMHRFLYLLLCEHD